MTLRYNPLNIFKASTTPAGLYARQKWLEEQQTLQWQSDFNSTTAGLIKGQDHDGAWRSSAVLTARQLFGLHLTIRQPTPQINKGLDWLLEQAECQLEPNTSRTRNITPSKMLAQLPFVVGRRDGFLLGVALFLASIFDRQHQPQILSLYQSLNEDAQKDRLFWKDPACFHNLFRAFVVHPDYATKSAVLAAVRRLERLQTAAGDWGPRLPFFQVVNALAHLDLPQADSQLERAFQYCVQLQRPDGTWSSDQPEWHTFLVVHALKNKNVFNIQPYLR
ncbi:MAG: hypothetical protein R3274_07940 [Desulfobacterales bacterium]|nr:hypothetical protein [Desulfobacterales bacterium]